MHEFLHFHVGTFLHFYASIYKWQARAAAVGLGKGYGAVFMLGLENKLYDMISGR